jgi:hypothetical protein
VIRCIVAHLYPKSNYLKKSPPSGPETPGLTAAGKYGILGKNDGGAAMEYVAVIGLLFAPVICLLCAGWFFVRWKNEHENQKLALRDRKTCFVWLIAAAASLVIFGVLKLLFPITA